ncbi:gas vesicle structural protein GvpA [Streptomyces sp. NPDC005349]|uniref:gas vesicle structural protein GvpA n=1 Tax=Streptomyces sp. NPDC005349 TaxID=3157037 RepID=UPI0033B96A45
MTVYTDEVVCAPRAGTLYDVMELILDRGMVIDVFVRVSLVGIEILKIDARIVVASVDTYLRFAEACNRLDLEHDSRSKTVPELFGGGPVSKTIGKAGAKRTARSLTDKVKDVLTPDDDTDDDEGSERAAEPERRRRSPAKKTSSSSSRRGSDDDRPRTRRRRAEEEE